MNRNSPVLESKRPRRPRWLSLKARLSLEAPPCLLAALLACLAMAGGCRSRADTATTPETPSTTRPDQAVPAAPASSIRQVPSPALDAVRYESGRSAGMNSMLEIVGGGVACFDFDRDGYCDLYFPGGGTLDRNAQTTAGVPGTMLRGGPAWEFHNVTAATGTAADRFYSHGATVADYTHDGFSDLLVYGYQGVCLLRNQGDGTFQDVTHQSGLTETPWVTAAAWGDLDGDGQLDLYLASYVLWNFQTHQICTADDGTPDVCSPTAYFGSPDALFLGSEDGRFSDQSTRLHGNRDGKGLGAIIARLSEEVADLDNDGYIDVVITHLDAPPVILETEPPEPCHWVRVHLVGTASCRTPIGAVVRLVVGDRSMVRQLYGGESYLSQSQPELFFHWPRGKSAEAELQVQ